MLSYFKLPLFCIAFLATIFFASLEYKVVLWILLLVSCIFLILKPKIGIYSIIGCLVGGVVFQVEYNRFFQSVPLEDGTYEAYVYQRELRKNNKQRIRLEINDHSVLATLNRYPVILKGDHVNIDCSFKKPEAFSGFAYDKYLYSQGVDLLCDVQQIEVEKHQPSTLFEKGRIVFAKKIRTLWPRPTSSLAAGLLLGTRESFSEGVLTNFSKSGITHIIALSGFNIAILIIFFEKILTSIMIPRFYRLIFVSLSIILFTIFVGAGASIMRASIMGSIAYIAGYFGKRGDIWRIMLFTAFCMTIMNPFVLAYDVGFQLSFLSTIGLIYITPLFDKLFYFVPDIFSLKESFTTTMAATLGTLPLILFQFGTVSFVSPVANIMILPVIPWLMLTSFIGVITPLFSKPFIYLTTLGSRYVLRVSEVFAGPAWGSMQIDLSEIGFFVSWFCLFFTIYFSVRYAKR